VDDADTAFYWLFSEYEDVEAVDEEIGLGH
jgi:hypothetical protein